MGVLPEGSVGKETYWAKFKHIKARSSISFFISTTKFLIYVSRNIVWNVNVHKSRIIFTEWKNPMPRYDGITIENDVCVYEFASLTFNMGSRFLVMY